jgi:hypothetical protein
MQKWEYWVIKKKGVPFGTSEMNEIGKDGWELVTIIEHPTDKTVGLLYYFKRAIG